MKAYFRIVFVFFSMTLLQCQSVRKDQEYGVNFPKCPRGEMEAQGGNCVSVTLGAANVTKGTPTKLTFENGEFDIAWMQQAYSGDHSKDSVDPNDVSLWFRAVTRLPTCPLIRVNDDRDYQEMKLRVQLNDKSLADAEGPTRVCQFKIERGTKSLVLWKSIGKNRLFRVPQESNESHVFIIGDSGKHYLADPSVLLSVSNEIRRMEKLDSLVLHVGDYLYSTKGKTETWNAWYQEFFKPIQPLTDFAFLFVRGNHEGCKASDAYSTRGWFWFLDAAETSKKGEFKGASDPSCKDVTPSFNTSFAGMSFGVLDSASSDKKHVDLIKKQLIAMDANFSSNAFVVTHRPFWGYIAPSIASRVMGYKPEITANLQAAYKEFLKHNASPKFKHILSGHVHNFDFMRFKDPRVNQLIVGMSGNDETSGDKHSAYTDLDPKNPGAGKVDLNSEPKAAIEKHGFAYLKKEDPNLLHVKFLKENEVSYSISN